jgi:hypothetical protein
LVKLELTADEVQGILQVLGDLPTKTGAWPLVKKIEEQAAAQLPAEDAAS